MMVAGTHTGQLATLHYIRKQGATDTSAHLNFSFSFGPGPNSGASHTKGRPSHTNSPNHFQRLPYLDNVSQACPEAATDTILDDVKQTIRFITTPPSLIIIPKHNPF